MEGYFTKKEIKEHNKIWETIERKAKEFRLRRSILPKRIKSLYRKCDSDILN